MAYVSDFHFIKSYQSNFSKALTFKSNIAQMLWNNQWRVLILVEAGVHGKNVRWCKWWKACVPISAHLMEIFKGIALRFYRWFIGLQLVSVPSIGLDLKVHLLWTKVDKFGCSGVDLKLLYNDRFVLLLCSNFKKLSCCPLLHALRLRV